MAYHATEPTVKRVAEARAVREVPKDYRTGSKLNIPLANTERESNIPRTRRRKLKK